MELCQNSELFKAPKRAVLPHFQLTLTSVILGSSSCNYADLVTLPFSIKKAQGLTSIILKVVVVVVVKEGGEWVRLTFTETLMQNLTYLLFGPH